ncbi:FAD-dependent oxidoreductase domain-containing protein 1 isoform X1 [Calliopsis andreniformis]|uniref:FAD-dependent oxidoreductase domain-containing protein 1 isoform X1 n=1 Tax=Calliopsis andreniformis TaxID=337506 RepID=UPI003FCC3872
MLRIFKNGTRINLCKHVSFRSERTYSEKGIIKKILQKPTKSSVSAPKQVKNKLQLVKNMIAPWQYKPDDIVPWSDRPLEVPCECDIVIIGGGVIGSSIAYWLKKTVYRDMKVVVVERDPTYKQSSSVLSVGGLRQQFSLEENIEMSLFGAEFIRNINDYLGIEGEPPVDVYFHPYGYLMLAGEKGTETLMQNSKMQNFLGAKNILLSKHKLKDLFPWLNTEDLIVGCLGLEKEGWFDPWSLLCAFKKKALVLGAQYVYGEAKGFTYTDINKPTGRRLDKLIVDTSEGEKAIKFAIAVVAAGASSGHVAGLAEVDFLDGVRHLALPVEPRKRYVYCFHCPEGPGLNTPLTIDYTGTYFRREGLVGTYICGRSPSESDEPSTQDLSVDHEYFNEQVWPMLAQRVKAFEKLKVKSSWAGYYDYNTFDQNGIIGIHPFHSNLLLATGFSGHGIQQAPAVGRAITELIIEGKFVTLDLSKLGFDRFIYDSPMYESNIV